MKETPFSSVLVANRGEIALRIMRSVRRAGMRAIGVVTDADADALHARFADQVINIGAGPAGASYLSIEKIIAAAKKSGADAVHPGYGFLSENPDFAQACKDAGLVFIGPSVAAMAVMGNKASARRAAVKAGVACVPGYNGTAQSDTALTRAAREIGYPVMIKAALGGGGRGLQRVETPDALLAALARTKSEALAAFGTGEILLEKAIVNARHIEVQIIADRAGQTIHLGERDCSVQRRHQKIIEEAPAPGISDSLRARLGAAAIKVARAVAYEGAGTVEFLLDQSGAFYFLEMNTRLQVEHGVTEAVTGLDLVLMQLNVACGQPLSLSQKDVAIQGHAIEARLYAEDPAKRFLPSSGRLLVWDIGAHKGVRVDAGVVAGGEVTSFYDPMLAKLIVHEESRDAARLGLIAALETSAIFGPVSNRDFLIEVLAHQRFAAGAVTTDFLSRKTAGLASTHHQSDTRLIAAAAALLWQHDAEVARKRSCATPRALVGWGSPGRLVSKMRLREGDLTYDLTLTRLRNGALEVGFNGESSMVQGTQDGLRVDGARIPLVGVHASGRGIFLATTRRTLCLERVNPGAKNLVGKTDGKVTAPMHGLLREVLVTAGQQVAQGERLAVLEAMKMQHEILCEGAGVVTLLPVTPGKQVKAGDLIVEIKPD